MSTLRSQINHTVLVFAEFMMDTLQHTNPIMTCTLIINVSLSSMPIVLPQQKAGLVNDAIVSSQLTLANAKRPEKTLLNLICNGIKSYQANLFNQIMSDDSFIPESGAGNAFPYAMLSSPPEDSNDFNVVKPKPDLFGFFEFHTFTNVHFIFSVSTLSEIEEKLRPKFVIWDKHDEITETDDTKINFLLHTISQYNDKAFIPVVAQFPKVSDIYSFLKGKLRSFVEQRHTFLHEVMVVIESIESAMKDCDKRAANLKEQIRIDENMKVSAETAVKNAMTVVINFTGDLTKAESEYQIICEENQKLIDYMEKDGSKTLDAYKKAQKKAQKSFNADEQYKLYAQQRPSQEIQDLFAAYCILIGLTPRSDYDYWPEARGILKSSRMPQAIQLFDPNTIQAENLEKFDVAMQKVDESKFRIGSPCYNFAVWLKAIHVHSKRTSFNTCVNPKMSEMMLAKSRKEEEIASLKERLKAAQDDADSLKDALK